MQGLLCKSIGEKRGCGWLGARVESVRKYMVDGDSIEDMAFNLRKFMQLTQAIVAVGLLSRDEMQKHWCKAVLDWVF